MGAIAAAAAGVVLNCWAAAAVKHDLPVDLLYAVAAVESGHKVGAIGRNTNGTRDIGLMQINTTWLPLLSRYGITERILLDQPCTNIQVGAWILAQEVRRYGYTWQAIGAYNAGPIAKKASAESRRRKLATYQAYSQKVLLRWRDVVASREAKRSAESAVQISSGAAGLKLASACAWPGPVSCAGESLKP